MAPRGLQRLFYGGHRPVDILMSRAEVAQGNPHHAHAVPHRRSEPGFATVVDAPDNLTGPPIVIAIRVEKPHQSLVDDGCGQDLHARQIAQPGDNVPSQVTAALDDPGDPVASQASQGRIERDAAGPSRPLRPPLELIAHTLHVDLVRCRHGHGRSVGFGVGHKGDATVVGNVEPLVAVRRPGVGLLDPSDEVAEALAGGDPQAEGTIDVDPGAGVACPLYDLLRRIERA